MRKCAICEKSSRMAGTRILLRGHYNPTNWTRKYPNLQVTTSPKGERVLACTQCIRTFGKTARLEKKAVVKAELAAKKAAALVAEVKAEAPKKPAKKEKTAPKAKKESK